MSHQEKQRIFDEYAQKKISKDWNSYLNWMIVKMKYTPEQITERIMDACDKVQEEQQKRISENAKTETKIMAYGLASAVDKSSIINTENLIS